MDKTNIFRSNFSIHDGNLMGADGNEKLTNLIASSIVYLPVGLPRFLDAAALALWPFF